MMTKGRLKRKETLPKITGKHKMKHRNVTLRLMSITNDKEHEQIKEDTGIEKEENREPENNKEEEIVKNEEITMVQLQSEDNEKKIEVVGKAGNNQEKATKEQTENKNMILNKDENIESNKSEGKAKSEDEQYGKQNQQCQKHEK